MPDHACCSAAPDGATAPPAWERRALLVAAAAGASYAVLGGTAHAVAPRDLDRRGRLRRTVTLEERRTFTGLPGEGDWHYVPVEVPKGVRAIEVELDYEPLPTGVGFTANVVDLGLLDPGGFRGWSGGARRSFRVARGAATPGYLPGRVRPGTWQVALGPFAVVPPGVEAVLRIRLVPGAPGPAYVPAPPARRVAGRGRGWYAGDLHVHTDHSDGSRSLAALVAEADAAGLDWVISTEHNTPTAHLELGRAAEAAGVTDLLLVPGEEVTTRAGHWLAAALPPGAHVDWRYRPTDPDGVAVQAEAAERVRSLGGLAVVAHPFAPTPGARWEFGADWAGMDAVELWNGPWTLDDQVGVATWHALLVAGRFVPAVGTSDSHRPSQPVGTARTVALLDDLSVGSLVAALRAGRSWLAEDARPSLSLVASAGDRSATIGEGLGAAATDLVEVRLAVGGVPGCLALLLGPVGVLGTAVADGEGAAEVVATVPAALAPFVRAEVRRLDGAPVINPLEGVPGLAMVAFTNPVWLGARPQAG